jgi:HTH-type transcriptional regulator / antitoxin HigA
MEALKRLIKNEADYTAALAQIEILMDAEAETPEADLLELYTTLVEIYENEKYPINFPSPADAIRFRMEQEDMNQSDLAKLLQVSRSKVSEILSGKRQLTLAMIRTLNARLEIPFESLMSEGAPPETLSYDWHKFPVMEMANRGWFPDFVDKPREAPDYAEELMRDLMVHAGCFNVASCAAAPRAHFRKHIRNNSSNNNAYALDAWLWRVAGRAMREQPIETKYKAGSLNELYMRSLAGFSQLETGHLLVKESLNLKGIRLVFEPHLKGTHLDGVAFLGTDEIPVVALTIRYDRVDHFWFTLFHELAHVDLHIEGETGKTFIDNLDVASNETIEIEADKWASDRLIPKDVWTTFMSQWHDRHPSISAVTNVARCNALSPAIFAGRIRKEKSDFRLYSALVGTGKIRNSYIEQEVKTMATNPPKGDGHRVGAVKDRSQFKGPNGNWTKRDGDTGRIMDQKTSGGTFKGVRKEK